MDTFRLTAAQHRRLQHHLFDGSDLEAVAVGLLGQTAPATRRAHLLHRITEIPYAECVRAEATVTWPTRRLRALLPEAGAGGMKVLKIHSHPNGYRGFSALDDASDRELFAAVSLKVPGPHISAVMLPDGEILARLVMDDGTFRAVDRVAVVGDDLVFWPDPLAAANDFDQRHRQVFGDRTTNLLRALTVAVVGISGTGSPTVEMLARLGVGRILLIDPDVVEGRNLNRIWGSTRSDAEVGANKALMMRGHLDRMGLGTDVVDFQGRVDTVEAIQLISIADVLIGCVDSLEGRDTLNRVATFYTLPYLDIGVRLDADGQGGVASVSAAVHYLQPGGASLKSRGVYSDEGLRAEYLKRTDQPFYEDQVRRGYIRGVRVDSPAVISVNTLAAASAVNELLARLHPFRTVNNADVAVQKLLLTHGRTIHRGDGDPDLELAPLVGRGDCTPPIGCGRIETAAA
ncbi:ThiF family adenylyltransferase [Brevundimonas abyssalis]|nr:ThiF family adenylyltransferase [Brevundimonas abyssalis]